MFAFAAIPDFFSCVVYETETKTKFFPQKLTETKPTTKNPALEIQNCNHTR